MVLVVVVGEEVWLWWWGWFMVIKMNAIMVMSEIVTIVWGLQ